jgi:uncharacterized Zn finger protein
MLVTLDNFEQAVESKIVERGLDYFENGDVARLEQVGTGEFSAIVLGSERYEVFVRLDGKAVAEHECDCPYDWRDVCKHRVAVFYAIRGGDFSDTGDKLNSLLENLHDSALRRFVSNLLKKDRSFRQRFLREFDEDFEDDEDFEEDYY